MISATKIHLQPQITFRMTKPQKNAIFKAETVLSQGKWNPCDSDWEG